jgi:phosphate-selective porin
MKSIVVNGRAVLSRTHCPRVNVHIGVNFNRSDFETRGFEQQTR